MPVHRRATVARRVIILKNMILFGGSCCEAQVLAGRLKIGTGSFLKVRFSEEGVDRANFGGPGRIRAEFVRTLKEPCPGKQTDSAVA